MRDRNRRPLLAMLWTLALLAPGRAGADPTSGSAPPRLPTAALQAAFEAERERGVERSEVLARALVATAPHLPAARRDAALVLAGRADPTLAEPHLARARLALGRFDPAGAAAAVVDAWKAVALDARQTAVWIRRLARGLHTLGAACLATLTLLCVVRGFRLARHALGERLGSPSAAAVLIVAPLAGALVASWALGLVVVVLAFASFLRRRERLALAVPCALLAGIDLALPALAPYAMLLDPSTRSAQIARLNDGGPDPESERRLQAVAPRRPEIDLVLGLQARRRGDFAAAHAHYVACLRADSTCAAAYVDLSNLYFRAGELERAAAGYRAAQALAPERSLPYANLAQTYIRMLHYGESDRELRAAAAHGFEAVARRRALWRDPDVPVLDMTRSRAEILQDARLEAGAEPLRVRRLLQSWRSPGWREVRLDAAPWLLLGVALMLGTRLRLRGLVSACPGCHGVLCAHCAAGADGEPLCGACETARLRHPGRTFGFEATAAPVRRRVGPSTGRWMAGLFPGAADLVRGAPLAALAGTALGWTALLGVAAAVDAARLRVAPWYAGVDAPILQFGLVLFGLAWLPGLVRLRRRDRVRRGPSRSTPQTQGA
jgi:hypothetical protein